MPTCLGRIPPSLLGGEIVLDREAARQIIQNRIARPLGLGLNDAAAGIIEIINNNMARAIRTVSIRRGHDPPVWAGGLWRAGPLHACRLAELLDIPAIVIPLTPGVLSTSGLLSTDLKNDYDQTCYQEGPQYDLARMTAVYADLEAQALAWLRTEQVPAEAQQLIYAADLRYAHQSFELTCPMPVGHVTQALVQELVTAFHREHRRLVLLRPPKRAGGTGQPAGHRDWLVAQASTSDCQHCCVESESALAEVRQVYFDQGEDSTLRPARSAHGWRPGMTFEVQPPPIKMIRRQ